MNEKPLVVHDSCRMWLDKLNKTTEEKFQCILDLEESNVTIANLQEQLKTVQQTSFTLGFNKGRKCAIAEMQAALTALDLPLEGR
jgi:hypothetical protein